jgi:hypothetical protein
LLFFVSDRERSIPSYRFLLFWINGHGYAPVDGSMLVYGTLQTPHTLDAGDNLGILPTQLVITLAHAGEVRCR